MFLLAAASGSHFGREANFEGEQCAPVRITAEAVGAKLTVRSRTGKFLQVAPQPGPRGTARCASDS